jgi:Fe-S oxidoreductase
LKEKQKEPPMINDFVFINAVTIQQVGILLVAYFVCGAGYSAFEYYINVRNIIQAFNPKVAKAYSSLTDEDRKLFEEITTQPVPVFNFSKSDQKWADNLDNMIRKIVTNEKERNDPKRSSLYNKMEHISAVSSFAVRDLAGCRASWAYVAFWPGFCVYRVVKEPAKYIYDILSNVYNDVKAYAVAANAKDIN